jgi:hypothetical protein
VEADEQLAKHFQGDRWLLLEIVAGILWGRQQGDRLAAKV